MKILAYYYITNNYNISQLLILIFIIFLLTFFKFK